LESVVFGDHRFCAGRELVVAVMAEAHSHSQIEINFVLSGTMTYLFNGRRIRLDAGELALFWGAVPHQVIEREAGTRFVCLYVPVSVFLSAPLSEPFRAAILNGAFVEAAATFPNEAAVLTRLRENLLSGEPRWESLVLQEILARIQRVDLEGWADRAAAPAAAPRDVRDAHALRKVEAMTRWIAENVSEPFTVADVARSAGLHPNYAMTVFKKAVGVTIAAHVKRQRLNAAQALLLSTDRDIAEIAFDCGFGSLSRFYEAFRREFRVAPRAFRRLHAAPR
jgi:AraC-like DNA-binding protein